MVVGHPPSVVGLSAPVDGADTGPRPAADLMASVVYDGREYPIPDAEVDEVVEAVRRFTQVTGWLTIGNLELFVGPNIPIAIRRNP